MMKTAFGHIEIYKIRAQLEKSGKWYFVCSLLIGDGNRGNSSIKLSNGFSVKRTDHVIWNSTNFIDILSAKARVKQYAEQHQCRYIDSIFPIDIHLPDLYKKMEKNHLDYHHCSTVLYPELLQKIEQEIKDGSEMSPETAQNLIKYYQFTIDIYQQSIDICKFLTMRKSVAPHPVEFYDNNNASKEKGKFFNKSLSRTSMSQQSTGLPRILR